MGMMDWTIQVETVTFEFQISVLVVDLGILLGLSIN